MKILLYGDSITDAGRNKEARSSDVPYAYGYGYPTFIAGELYSKDPEKYTVLNRGISGNRIVDLYSRIKCDVWNEKPDVLSILIGINDIWHELNYQNGVELDRFDKVYRMLIEDTKKVLPDVKIMLIEPFVLKGKATEDKFEGFTEVYRYSAAIKKIAEDYSCVFVPVQDKLSEAAEKHGAEHYLYDGVHPMLAGAKLIADEWLKAFKNDID